MNEFQVIIGEIIFGGWEELVDFIGIMDYGSLIYVVFQCFCIVKEVIQVMMDLVKEYGYYSSGELFSIVDFNEVWILEMIGKGFGVKGVVWVVVCILDDCIVVYVNQSWIYQFNMNDKDNCFYFLDVIFFVCEKGYFDGMNKDFSFLVVYNFLDFGGVWFCEVCVWSFYNMFNKLVGDIYFFYIQGDSKELMFFYIKFFCKFLVCDV